MKTKLIITFENLSEANFLVKVETISTSLPNNAASPLPWPNTVAGPAEITSDVAAYQLAYTAAKDGDRTKIKIRSTDRINLSAKLKKVASYLEIVADGDAALLGTTGFDLRHDSVKSTSQEPLGPLTGLKLTRGALSGVVYFHAKADRKADVYNVQTTFGDPAVEASWGDAGTYTHCNKIELDGLTPGKTYYVRIRGFNKNGHGVWTNSAGILVL